PIAQHVRNRVGAWLMSHDAVQERAVRNGAMLTVNYRQSPIVGEQRSAITRVILPGSRDAHEPGLTQWLDFAHGPCPGDRVPDGIVTDPATGAETRLFEHIRGTTHHLLLFTGVDTSAADYDSLIAAASTAQSDYPDQVVPHYIVSGKSIPQELLREASLLLDPELSLHHKYGASFHCLYLVRPDGYVGFRSQPADIQVLG